MRPEAVNPWGRPSGDRNFWRFASDTAQAIETGSTPMGGESTVPGCKHGRHDPEFERVLGPRDGVDPPVDPEQDAEYDPVPDGLLGESETDQLSKGHEAMLTPS